MKAPCFTCRSFVLLVSSRPQLFWVNSHLPTQPPMVPTPVPLPLPSRTGWMLGQQQLTARLPRARGMSGLGQKDDWASRVLLGIGNRETGLTDGGSRDHKPVCLESQQGWKCGAIGPQTSWREKGGESTREEREPAGGGAMERSGDDRTVPGAGGERATRSSTSSTSRPHVPWSMALCRHLLGPLSHPPDLPLSQSLRRNELCGAVS